MTPAQKRRHFRTEKMRRLAHDEGSRATHDKYPRHRRNKNRRKARVPGTIRISRMPGGSGFRGYKQWYGNGHC